MLGKKGQQVKLSGWDGVVTASWFYLKRDGKLEKRFVISTRALKGSTIAWWGSRRWAIEGFFKTAKYRFGLSWHWSTNTLRYIPLADSELYQFCANPLGIFIVKPS
jgi:hypothetical protein